MRSGLHKENAKEVDRLDMVEIKNIAIVLAGGSGCRMGMEIPKQFLQIAGKTVLEHTLTVFQNNSHIDNIIIVTHPDYYQNMKSLLAGNFNKVCKIVDGGAERYHSTLAALRACEGMECNFIIHDAVRPLVSDQIINDNVKALLKYDACTTAIPSTDTILESDTSGNFAAAVPNRQFLYNVQTPQSFKKNVLEKAYALALQDPDFRSTDDCGVVMKYLPATKIKIVKGSPDNIKLTYTADIALLEELLKCRYNNS